MPEGEGTPPGSGELVSRARIRVSGHLGGAMAEAVDSRSECCLSRPAKSTIPCGVVGLTVSSMSHSTMLRWRSLLGVQPPYPTTRLSMLRRTVTRRKFFVGVKERLDPYAVFPFVWRRVVFWTHQRFEQFRTIEGLGGTRFRLGVTYGVSDLSAFDIQELMFKGSAGVDWDTTRPIDARLDTQRIRVVSDRKVNFNPNSEQGRYSLFKRWHPIRRKIIYDQQENGDDMTPNYWSTVSPTSSGNLYIVDFFGFPPGLGQERQRDCPFRALCTGESGSDQIETIGSSMYTISALPSNQPTSTPLAALGS